SPCTKTTAGPSPASATASCTPSATRIRSTPGNLAVALGRPVTAAARRLDAQPIAGAELALRLAGKRLAVQEVSPRRAVRAALGAPRRVPPALGDEREAHRRQRLQLAHDPVAAPVAAGSAAAAAERQLADADRKLGLQGLDGRVERVRHRDVDGARPVGVRAGALAAPDRLVVGEARTCEG